MNDPTVAPPMRKSGPSARSMAAVQVPLKRGSAGGNGRGNFLRLAELVDADALIVVIEGKDP